MHGGIFMAAMTGYEYCWAAMIGYRLWPSGYDLISIGYDLMAMINYVSEWHLNLLFRSVKWDHCSVAVGFVFFRLDSLGLGSRTIVPSRTRTKTNKLATWNLLLISDGEGRLARGSKVFGQRYEGIGSQVYSHPSKGSRSET